ncbi:hypothetical protein C2G38_2211480 [Gigaspora rosea]|uniref:Uncharacterized protein n=1 Tax=Gigaspora rosea TaxID=44941 RepID=A0A397UFX6_9GLOM|nr:hypothetical protein C2G38_2211480 [Gigaspora rosea]
MNDTQEIHNYPFDSTIKFKHPKHSFLYKVIKEGTYPNNFLYKVIKEGTYPNKSLLAHTFPPNKYQIPDNYTIETTWGRGHNQCTVQCSINYNMEGPVFQIHFGKHFEYEVSSSKTATDAANLFYQKHTPEKRTKTSGIYLFGLHLKILNEKISEAYNSDDIPRLESLSYSVKKHTYVINYGDNDKIKKKQKTELIAKTFDKQNISRNSYRDLYIINKGQIDQTEEADIDDEFIVQEVVNTVGKGGYRSIKNIYNI